MRGDPCSQSEDSSVEPLVSIIIPVLNGERHVGACITSVLSQSYGNLEIIVADNASKDRTVEIVQAFGDPRIRLLPGIEGQLSLHENWSRAVKEGKGDLVKIVCHDDVLLPECVSVQVRLLQAYPTAVLASGRRRIIDDQDSVVIRSRGLGDLVPSHGTRLVHAAEIARACTRAGTNLLGEPAGVLIRRSVLPDPLFDPCWNYALDIEFYMRCTRGGDVALDSQVLSGFRVSPHQLSASLSTRQASEMRAFLKQMAVLYPEDVSTVDVRIGMLRSQLIVQARRLLYQLMRIRSSMKWGRRQ